MGSPLLQVKYAVGPSMGRGGPAILSSHFPQPNLLNSPPRCAAKDGRQGRWHQASPEAAEEGAGDVGICLLTLFRN